MINAFHKAWLVHIQKECGRVSATKRERSISEMVDKALAGVAPPKLIEDCILKPPPALDAIAKEVQLAAIFNHILVDQIKRGDLVEAKTVCIAAMTMLAAYMKAVPDDQTRLMLCAHLKDSIAEMGMV